MWTGMQWVPAYAFSRGGSLLRCCLRLEMNGKQTDRGSDGAELMVTIHGSLFQRVDYDNDRTMCKFRGRRQKNVSERAS